MVAFCVACLLQIFLGSDPVWGLTFYLQASMQNDKKAGDPSTNMDGSPAIRYVSIIQGVFHSPPEKSAATGYPSCPLLPSAGALREHGLGRSSVPPPPNFRSGRTACRPAHCPVRPAPVRCLSRSHAVRYCSEYLFIFYSYNAGNSSSDAVVTS